MEKDTKWKSFLEDNRRYADIINGLGCGGRQLVSADDLQEEDSTSGKRSRDTLRRVALGMNFVIVGIKNQEEPDYELPFRNMAYDVGVYGKQMVKIRREVRGRTGPENLMPGEYLYGFKKDSRLRPVITFVLYSGESWDGARRLHEILDFTDVPESLQSMTPDYKINVIEIRNLKHTEVFQTDVKQVFDFIRLSEDKEALLKLVENDDSYKHMEEDAFEIIATYTNSKELRKQMEKMQQESKKEEEMDMCKAIKDLMEDSRAEGLAMGREEGREAGLIEGIRKMTEKMLQRGDDIEAIIELTELTKEEISEIEREMLVSQ